MGLQMESRTGKVMMDLVHIDSFSRLGDLKPKERSDHRAVLRALDKAGKFSVFEATEHADLAGTLTALPKHGLVVYHGDEEGFAYPWTGVTLTDEGRALAYGASESQRRRCGK